MTMPDPDVEGAPRSTGRKHFSRLPFLIALFGSVVVIATIGFAVYLKIQKPMEKQVHQNNEISLRLTGLTAPVVNKLSPEYTDANGNLIADPPSDPAKQVDPDTLAISYVAAEDPGKFRDGFKELIDHLAKETGKKISYDMINDTDDELKQLHDGRLQIAAFGTGTVPLAVDACGFVPICRTGGSTEDGYHMLIIVPTDSPIRQISDLKGHELGVTEPTSNSGYKAALVFLSKDFGLNPGPDFALRFSGGQETSIGHIADGSYQAAAVASDVLERAVAEHRIKQSDYRVVYSSELFPTAAFGYAYNLKPELAAKLKKAMLDFDWSNTGLEELFGAAGQTKFIPVDYKNDWALVRRIDDAIGNAHVLK
jgi:phosphonate transport system substrate-binding protein